MDTSIEMLAQNLKGKKILDNAAASNGRCKEEDFIGDLEEKTNIILTGVGGRVHGHPKMGSVMDGTEVLSNVVHTPFIDYDIDSEHQMFEEGYVEDKSTGKRHRRYEKQQSDGSVKVRVYEKPEGGTHFIRIQAMSQQDLFIEQTVKKMRVKHKDMGHLPAQVMLDLTKIYSEEALGYTAVEAKIFLNHGDCHSCLQGKSIARKKGETKRLIYKEFKEKYEKEGIHIDAFFVNRKFAFLVARSSEHKMLWVYDIGLDFDHVTVKRCLASILGDYKYASVGISFLRSDSDRRFQPLMEWIQSMGIRWYMNPPDMHATKIEIMIRYIKNICRTILFSVEFDLPDKYIPYLVREAVRLITVRYDPKLGKTPRESFFKETTNYSQQYNIHFGCIISYTGLVTTNSIHESRLHYGVVLGTDVLTGNVIIEDLATKNVERISMFTARIPVDDSIRKYFQHYDNVVGLNYSPHHSVIISVQDALNLSPLGLEGLRKDPRWVLGEIEIVSSQMYYESQLITDGSSIAAENASALDEQARPVRQDSSSEGLDTPTGKATVLSKIEHIAVNVMQEIGISAEALEADSPHNFDNIPELRSIDDPTDNFNSHPNDYYHLVQNVVQMNYTNMKKLHPEDAHGAAIKEYTNVDTKETLAGVLLEQIPKGAHIGYIMSKFVEKLKHGVYDRCKGRLLFGGNEYKDEYDLRWDEISARTISSNSLFTIIAIMAFLGMSIGTMDFTAAFLNAKLPLKDQCYAKLSKSDSKILIEVNPSKWKPFLNKDGHIYVKVTGALYGHPLAPILWYNYLKEKLALIGFVPLLADCCIFIRRYEDGTFDLIGVHVDDLLMGSLKPGFFDEMKTFLDVHFRGEGTMVVGPIQDYLSMTLKFKTDGSVEITQEHYWKKVCNKFSITEGDVAKLPYKNHFMKSIRTRDALENVQIDETQRNKFLSVVMSILWGGRLSLPDTLFTGSVLATRSKFGLPADLDDSMVLLKYINGHKPEGITLKIHGKPRVCLFVDSSSFIHPQMQGQEGWVATISDECYGGPIAAHSGKSKMNATSSMVYELYALHNGLPTALFLHELLTEIGFPQEPIIVFEDNKSLIDLLKRGKISTGATRHIAAKFYWAKDLILSKLITLRHCPTLLMIADIFTKDLPGPVFHRLSSRLRSWGDQDALLSDDVYRRLFANSSESVYHDEEDKKVVELLSMIIERIIQS